MANDLNTDTLEAVFNRLLDDGEKDAALTVASLAFDSSKLTPRSYLESCFPNGLQGTNKVQVIKQVRDEFGLSLKDAKAVVNKFQKEVGAEFVETDSILDVAEIHLPVIVDGSEDEIVDLDEDTLHNIATEKRGWLQADQHSWKVPADAT
jgi:hypothetical protein